MDATERQMHLDAGRAYGRASTCVDKVDYKSEITESTVAEKMSRKHGRTMECYPCFWCDGWHIGRAMTSTERVNFLGEV